MKNFDTDLQKYANKVRLRAAERRELRDRVLTYMEYHPLPKQTKQSVTNTVSSDRFISISFNTVYTKMAAGFFAVILIVGIPVAAERSVPGDVLYPVKTQFNEGIRAQFVNSPYERVTFETELLERRISEARLLAKEGRLTEEVEAEIAATVRGHAEAAQQGIAALKNTDADEGAIAEISFGSTLDVQSAVLTRSNTVGFATGTTNGIATVVREARENAEAHKATTTPSYGRLMARVELETTRAYELFEAIDESATAAERADIKRRLEDIGRAIEKAQKENEENGEHTTERLVNALSLTQKLIVFMTDIDVRENVSLESIVPVVLTDAERYAELSKRLHTVEVTWGIVLPRIDLVEDEALLEKLVEGRTIITTGLASTTEALANGEYETAENMLFNAEALVVDLDKLTADIEVERGTSTPEVSDDQETEGENDLEDSSATSTRATSTDAATNDSDITGE